MQGFVHATSHQGSALGPPDSDHVSELLLRAVESLRVGALGNVVDLLRPLTADQTGRPVLDGSDRESTGLRLHHVGPVNRVGPETGCRKEPTRQRRALGSTPRTFRAARG